MKDIVDDADLTAVPIVMMCYSDQRSVRDRFRPGGRTGLLKKPVLEEALRVAVVEAGRSAHPTELSRELSALSRQVEPRPHGYRILVCEDNLVNQKVATRLLNSQGHV